MEIKRTVRFANSPLPTPKGISSESENFLINNSDRAQETVEVKEIESQKDLGYKSLRNNYKLIKPYSKYTEENIRPSSPNTPYSFLSEQSVKNNPQNRSSAFMPTNYSEPSNKRHFNERHVDTYNQHLIRGISASQPYCYITKEAHNRFVPIEYSSSSYGSYPTWGIDDAGFRTRSHYVAEFADRFSNIDMYKRPMTNQSGNIIFDHGRPNNGYNLQRNQYDNTYFNSSLKLNKTDILKSINPKTRDEYKSVEFMQKSAIKANTSQWPYSTEYTHRFALNN